MITGWRKMDSAEQNPSVTWPSFIHQRPASGEFGSPSSHPTHWQEASLRLEASGHTTLACGPIISDTLWWSWTVLGWWQRSVWTGLRPAQDLPSTSTLWPLHFDLVFIPDADELLFPYGVIISITVSQSLPSSAFTAFPLRLYLGFFNQHELASSKTNGCNNRTLNHQAGEGVPSQPRSRDSQLLSVLMGERGFQFFSCLPLTSPLGFYRKCGRLLGCSFWTETERKPYLINSGDKDTL